MTVRFLYIELKRINVSVSSVSCENSLTFILFKENIDAYGLYGITYIIVIMLTAKCIIFVLLCLIQQSSNLLNFALYRCGCESQWRLLLYTLLLSVTWRGHMSYSWRHINHDRVTSKWHGCDMLRWPECFYKNVSSCFIYFTNYKLWWSNMWVWDMYLYEGKNTLNTSSERLKSILSCMQIYSRCLDKWNYVKYIIIICLFISLNLWCLELLRSRKYGLQIDRKDCR